MRRLIVNADDLGLTPGVNDGIFRAHHDGILTSASLFANADATGDAIARVADAPALGVGCHLALVDASPVLPASQVPTLVGEDERLRPSWKPFIRDAVRGRIALRDVERELTAQIDRLRSAGLTLTHLDAHKHVHAYPPVFEIVVRLARRFGIPAVRVPFELPRPWPVTAASLANLALWPWAARDRRYARQHGVAVARFTGRLRTGTLTRRAILDDIRWLPPGITELMVHPGDVDGALRRLPTRLLDSRAEEVAALCSPETWAAIDACGVTLVRHDGRPLSLREGSRAS